MNSTSTSADMPDHCCPLPEPAPATKHLTIDRDHLVPQLSGSAPPNALGARWQCLNFSGKGHVGYCTFLVSDLDRPFCHPYPVISLASTPMHHLMIMVSSVRCWPWRRSG
jgi:hypothetical protein